MYEIIQSVINTGNFELTDILKKIDTLWVQGSIDDDQRAELIAAARDKADPSASYAPAASAGGQAGGRSGGAGSPRHGAGKRRG